MVRTGKFADFSAVSRPFRAHVDIEDVEVEGDIPTELDGTFYRVMQDPYYERNYYLNGAKQIPFDGDGSVSAFRFRNGKASFQQRYVMTERLVAERKAGRALFGMNKNPKKPFTAHPHVDPETGDLVAFGYEMEGLDSPEISVYVINKDGKVTYRRDIEFYPVGGMFHDCAITRNYIVITRMPFVVDLTDVEKPGNHQYYDETCPAYFGLIPRDLNKPVRWFKYKNSMPIHTGASWEDDGKVYFDTTLASHNGLSFLPCRHGPSPDPKDVTVNHVKFCIDPSAESDHLEDPQIVFQGPCEFPRVDERFLMSKSRITWLACFDPRKGADRPVFQGLDALARVDSGTGEVEYFSPGPNCLVQEPAFSPRYPGAPEGDGFLITMIDNMGSGRNELIIQDTRDFQKIVAKVLLPFRLRSAVHGNWVDSSRIEGADEYAVQATDENLYPHIPTVKDTEVMSGSRL
ncbi:hypothetical protein KHU50_012320 [Colletotrichum sp. SAR 10_65]|nr:hypothetical protein KHU50_012320 [Colletotrichum sp. SAR 10_65]